MQASIGSALMCGLLVACGGAQSPTDSFFARAGDDSVVPSNELVRTLCAQLGKDYDEVAANLRTLPGLTVTDDRLTSRRGRYSVEGLGAKTVSFSRDEGSSEVIFVGLRFVEDFDEETRERIMARYGEPARAGGTHWELQPRTYLVLRDDQIVCNIVDY